MIRAEETSEKFGKLVITYGRVDGKQQEKIEIIKQGKNLGRANATTAFEQAKLEAQSRWNKQIERKCYGQTVEESAGKRALAPMLAQVYEKHLKKVQWGQAFVQPKLDGFRCLARREGNDVSLTSREGKPITAMEHVVETLKFVMQDGDTFDGELFSPGRTFEEIASAIKRKQETSESIRYNVYDCVRAGVFESRFAYVSNSLQKLGKENAVVPVATRQIADEDEVMEAQAAFVADGFEGAMLRHGDAEYEAGKRSYSLLKVKTFKDAEFKVTGFRAAKDGSAIFVCKAAGGAPFEVTAPGTMVEKRQYLVDAPSYVGKSLTVKYQEMTKTEKPVPRFPVAKAFRE